MKSGNWTTPEGEVTVELGQPRRRRNTLHSALNPAAVPERSEVKRSTAELVDDRKVVAPLLQRFNGRISQKLR